MDGLAKKLYVESYGPLPQAVKAKDLRASDWKILRRLLAKGVLAEVDLALAETLLKTLSESEAAAAVVCYLSLAVRQGHLCVSIDQESLCPDPQHCVDLNNQEAIGLEQPQDQALPEDFAEFSRLIKAGAGGLPREVWVEASERVKTPAVPIYRRGNLFYFQRYWQDETRLLECFKDLVSHPVSIAADTEKAAQEVESLLCRRILLPEQAEAVMAACSRSFTILCGGPGTGKTYTAGQMIKVLWHALPEEKRKHFKVALAAPTGKAASNLQRSLAKVAGELPGFPGAQAKTLHALLGLRPGKSSHFPKECLAEDLVIIDESSMVDVRLMGVLLRSVRPGARLILLGDDRQLPSVEAGSIFAELIKALDSSGSCVKLRHCLRSELKEIVDFAQAINDGNSAEAGGMLEGGAESSGVQAVSFGEGRASPFEVAQGMFDFACPYFSISEAEKQTPEDLLEAFNHFRILLPLRKGPLGVDEINRHFLRCFLREAKTGGRLAVPIMVVKNDHQLELANGETGVLLKNVSCERNQEGRLMDGDYAWFPPKDAGQPPRRLPALTLPPFEYAYAMTVHKSQGSEFDKVLLMLPEGSELFGREVLYTGVTRARKKLYLWTKEGVLEKTIARRCVRQSGISLRLAGKEHDQNSQKELQCLQIQR